MRLLLINGNTTEFVTETAAAEARRSCRAETEITAVTGTFGAAIIATRVEHAIAEHAMVELAARHAAACDAVVIAVSYDTGLRALRELLAVPVVGMTEAALLTACMLGGQIGLVSFGRRVQPLYRELVRGYGLDARIAGWRNLEAPSAYESGDTRAVDEMIVGAARDLVERDGAEVVILLGAVMAGAPRRVQGGCPCRSSTASLAACGRPSFSSISARRSRQPGVTPCLGGERSPGSMRGSLIACIGEVKPVRILVVNPNTTAAVTERLLDAGRAVATSGTELVGVTAERGVPYIATRAEAQIGGAVALEMLSEHRRGADAAIIAAFGDPGLFGARERVVARFPRLLPRLDSRAGLLSGGEQQMLAVARAHGRPDGDPPRRASARSCAGHRCRALRHPCRIAR
jgi:allantoin racemase